MFGQKPASEKNEKWQKERHRRLPSRTPDLASVSQVTAGEAAQVRQEELLKLLRQLALKSLLRAVSFEIGHKSRYGIGMEIFNASRKSRLATACQNESTR